VSYVKTQVRVKYNSYPIFDWELHTLGLKLDMIYR